jgi:hypothetical protein
VTTQSRRHPVDRGEAVHEGHDGVPGLRSYLGSRAVRPNLLARDSSRLILVQVSLPMIASWGRFLICTSRRGGEPDTASGQEFVPADDGLQEILDVAARAAEGQGHHPFLGT